MKKQYKSTMKNLKKRYKSLLSVVGMATIVCCMVFLSSCKQDKWLDWKVENEAWMEHNKTLDSIHVTDSGLQYKVLFEGNLTDAKPGNSSTVTIEYNGYLINGIEFDAGNSSFVVQQLVSGFAEGVKKMHVHADYILYIPWDLGYGEEGGSAEELSAAYIPPYSTLIFRVHLKAVSN